MEQKKTYVYLSMFNDVNVCKCLMSHMQIEADVHGVFLRVCMLWFVSTAQLEPGSRSDLSSFGTYKTPHVFQEKIQIQQIHILCTIMYRLLLPKMICAYTTILLFKRHWQPARGHHTLRPVPPTGKLTSSDMRYPGYPAPKPQYLQNTSNLTQ